MLNYNKIICDSYEPDVAGLITLNNCIVLDHYEYYKKYDDYMSGKTKEWPCKYSLQGFDMARDNNTLNSNI